MMERILKTAMALGAAAPVVLVIGVVVNAANGSKHAAALPANPTQPPLPIAGNTAVSSSPVPRPTVYTGAARTLSHAERNCAVSGKECRNALLVLINSTRRTRGAPPLRLDLLQSNGLPRTGAGIACVGSRGHSRAMARTGRVWHTDAQHASADFPRDICVPGVGAQETDQRVPGRPWTALVTSISNSVTAGPKSTVYKRLVSPHSVGLASA